MGSFIFQEIHFPGLALVVRCVILRLVFSICLEDFALPGGVAGIFTMEIAIQLGMFFMTFLTMLVLFFKLGALFLPLGVSVLL